MRSGLLRQASVELGEHLSMQPSSTERPRGGWLVRPLSRAGSSVYRARSPIDIRLAVTVPPRRFGAERRDDAVDEINSSRASDTRRRADNQRTVIELQAKRHEIDTTACSSLTQSELEPRIPNKNSGQSSASMRPTGAGPAFVAIGIMTQWTHMVANGGTNMATSADSSPVRPLIKHLTASPFLVASERNNELKKLVMDMESISSSSKTTIAPWWRLTRQPG